MRSDLFSLCYCGLSNLDRCPFASIPGKQDAVLASASMQIVTLTIGNKPQCRSVAVHCTLVLYSHCTGSASHRKCISPGGGLARVWSSFMISCGLPSAASTKNMTPSFLPFCCTDKATLLVVNLSYLITCTSECVVRGPTWVYMSTQHLWCQHFAQ